MDTSIFCEIDTIMDMRGGAKMSKRKKMLLREEDLDIYDPEYVEALLEDDEISVEEEGFMRGYNDQ